MNLKLAEYNLKTGKFERFLEIGKDFGYFGDHLVISDSEFTHSAGDGGSLIFNKELLDNIAMVQDGYKVEMVDPISYFSIYQKDKKDPLNRFNGLFDGRTYGEGKFVLILNIGKILQDDVLKSRGLGGDLEVASNQPSDEQYYFLQDEIIGNLHENPELYERISTD